MAAVKGCEVGNPGPLGMTDRIRCGFDGREHPTATYRKR
jgi:hypothetical protein